MNALRCDYRCRTCKYHDKYTWVCFNPDSEYRADITDEKDWCDEYMGEYMKYYVDQGGFKPVRGHETDAGMDIRTPIECVVPKGGSVAIDTLLHVEIPRGYYGKLESKSGLNVKHDIVCLGGVIDSGYSGSVVVKLYNLGDEDYTFKVGDKVVQMIIQPCVLEEWVEDNDFRATERGIDGFGSTGR